MTEIPATRHCQLLLQSKADKYSKKEKTLLRITPATDARNREGKTEGFDDTR